MKLNKFRDRSLIMGTFLAAQALQSWINDRSSLSLLERLILVALHFEGKSERVGPTRLAAAIGFSRSRVSQEISSLVRAGLIKRNSVASDARLFSISLTTSGEMAALSAIKNFTKLQNLVDHSIGEKKAEVINSHLLKIVKILNEKPKDSLKLKSGVR